MGCQEYGSWIEEETWRTYWRRESSKGRNEKRITQEEERNITTEYEGWTTKTIYRSSGYQTRTRLAMGRIVENLSSEKTDFLW